ncbi:hypothetical protein GCM10027167_89010 [Nocardia heshunensis]
MLKISDFERFVCAEIASTIWAVLGIGVIVNRSGEDFPPDFLDELTRIALSSFSS